MVRHVAPGDPDYPAGLLDLEEPPSIWVNGSFRTDPGVAVVGTRRCTRYGMGLADSFGAMLARVGWTVVSGLARGIDAAAHRGCLAASGHGVAVLGSGIDVCYPAENRAIFESLANGEGAVVSEYSPGTPPDRWRFPARNRIIAAISAAVVVVEAHAKGGALITARLAAEIGRPVFVVPGDVDRPASEGCNRLIKDGAHPVLGADDLIAELELILGPVARHTEVPDFPVGGVDIDELPLLWGLSPGEALVRLGKMELAGQLRREGATVYPK